MIFGFSRSQLFFVKKVGLLMSTCGTGVTVLCICTIYGSENLLSTVS
ncbi:hypothetical protein H206_05397 [Candidatus Electrothrix aarhusensis]|uniref:Uncharacterized protein n=1 Tax=Candidatus Electrothrix aarhusensis TaxID=1859131 RepID=A0A3S3QUE4_9BACT|nr:hypothetical protein H206_05397 [Candidatus Electrothrix aarhusensis]